KAGDALSAHAGDTLRIFIGARPMTVHVRAIVRNENLAAGGLPSGGQQTDPLVLLPLERVQRLLGHPGAVTTVLVSNRGDAQGGVAYSDDVTSGLRALLANTDHVA